MPERYVQTIPTEQRKRPKISTNSRRRYFRNVKVCLDERYMQNVSLECIRNAYVILSKYTPVGFCTQQPRYPLQHHPICTSGFIAQPDRENNVEQPGRVCKTERGVLVYVSSISSIMRAAVGQNYPLQ